MLEQVLSMKLLPKSDSSLESNQGVILPLHLLGADHTVYQSEISIEIAFCQCRLVLDLLLTGSICS